MTYTLWQTKFGGDPHLVGSTILLTGHPMTVIGITSANFLGERNQVDAAGLWVPLARELELEPERRLLKLKGSAWLDLLVRVKNSRAVPEISVALTGELNRWIRANPGEFPGVKPADLQKQKTELASASSGINDLGRDYDQSLKLLLAVAGFVLLIACANLANLMLVRGMSRQQELAVRSALGAPRSRLIRQMLIEAILLSLVGGAAALMVAYAGTRGILALALAGSQTSPVVASPSLPVLCFALLISLVTGVVFGTAPAWIASRANPVEALRGANRSTGDASALPQKMLVVLQAALSLTLLATAGLLVTSLRALEHQDFRFQPEGRLLVSLDLQAAGYKVEKLRGLYQQFDDVFGRLPGIETFAYATLAPMSNNNWNGGVWLPGVEDPNNVAAGYDAVSARYLESVGTRVLQGRGIDEHDTATSTHVAVVNEAFVRRFLKSKAPLGEHFGPDPAMRSEYVIVGVIDDTKYGDAASPMKPMYLTPITQTTVYTRDADIGGEAYKHFASNLIVKYRGDPASAARAVRDALRGIDPNIPIMHMAPYTDQLADNFSEQELLVRLTSMFGLLALVLAAVGLYGVTAYGVARRRSEIGIRMALGASRAGVVQMVVRGALVQVLIGLAVGIPLTFAAGKLIQHSLYQTSAFQPGVLLTVITMLLLATTVAALLPARRAAGINPMTALRME